MDYHRNVLSETRTFLKWCVKQQLLSVNPLDAVEGVGRRGHGKEQLRIDEARKGKGSADLLFGAHDRDWPRHWVQRMCREAKVPVVTAHGQRGLHATLAVEAGVTARAVADVLGHESFKTTTDGDTGPHCKDQSDAFDAADDESWDAVVDLEDKFDELIEAGTEEMTRCAGDGILKWECDMAHLAHVDALGRYDAAESLEASRWNTRRGASWGLVDCLSDHKFHGNIWF